MRDEDSLQRRNTQLLALLYQPLNFLIRVSRSPVPVFVSHLNAFPPTLLPLVCCILTEQFCTLLSLVPMLAQLDVTSVKAASYTRGFVDITYIIPLWAVLEQVVELVQRSRTLASDSNTHHYLMSFTAPAIQHLSKATLLLPRRTLHDAPTLAHGALGSQFLILSCSDQVHSHYSATGEAIPAGPGASNKSDLGQEHVTN